MAAKQWSIIANIDLARQNWEFFLSIFNQNIPTPDARAANVEFLRKSVTQDDWLLMASIWRDSEVETLLPRVLSPTLILHPRDYLNIPVAESAQVAAMIPNARLTLIDGKGAFGDAASGLKAIDEFLWSLPSPISISADSQATTLPSRDHLSSRQLEVLRLVALGKTNRQIAEILVLSERTVERHVADVYAKTGVSNRALAAVYAQQHGIL
jgi:DNA-binding CsgD family transcriptional regulator